MGTYVECRLENSVLMGTFLSGGIPWMLSAALGTTAVFFSGFLRVVFWASFFPFPWELTLVVAWECSLLVGESETPASLILAVPFPSTCSRCIWDWVLKIISVSWRCSYLVKQKWFSKDQESNFTVNNRMCTHCPLTSVSHLKVGMSFCVLGLSGLWNAHVVHVNRIMTEASRATNLILFPKPLLFPASLGCWPFSSLLYFTSD